MADISKIKSGSTTYDVKDAIARGSIAYGVCNSTTKSALKEVTITQPEGFKLTEGSLIAVRYTYTNTIVATDDVKITIRIGSDETTNKNITVGNDSVLSGTTDSAIYGLKDGVSIYLYTGDSYLYLTSSAEEYNQIKGFAYARISSATSVTAKTANVVNYHRRPYSIISINFTNDVAADSTMNINDTGALSIKKNAINITDGVIKAGDTATFMYANSAWNLISIDRIGDEITGGASTITTNDLTASRALVSDTNGKVAASSVTSTQLGYLSGVTSNVQTQLNGKMASTTIDTAPTSGSSNLISSGGVYTAINNAINGNFKVVDSLPTSDISTHTIYLVPKSASETNNAYDEYIRANNAWEKIGETTVDLSVKQDTITGGASTITTNDLTASRALVSDTNGKVAASSVTSTQLGYLSGVTSAIQTQLNTRALTNHASPATTYGVGTASNYGHCKTINNLTTSSHTNGYALSAYQGYLLYDQLLALANNFALLKSSKQNRIYKQLNTVTTSQWSNNACTITVNGLTADSIGTVGLQASATAAQREAARKAQIAVSAQSTNSMTIYCDGTVPTVNLPIQISWYDAVYKGTATWGGDTKYYVSGTYEIPINITGNGKVTRVTSNNNSVYTAELSSTTNYVKIGAMGTTGAATINVYITSSDDTYYYDTLSVYLTY